MAEALTTIHGRELGLTKQNNLSSKGIDITHVCADASILVGAESTNVRAITIQLKDANGDDLTTVEQVGIYMFTSSARTAYVVTGGSTGIAIGTDGALQTILAKKVFTATCEADGDIDLTWTDTGSEAASLGLLLPSGRFIQTAAITNSTT